MTSAASPQVSVVVPAYNAALTLPRCLAALKSQTYPPPGFEIIVVDDGSTDATTQIAADCGADRVLTCPHRGPAAARNAGIQAARGQIVLFTDADCEPVPDWVAEMTHPFADPLVVGVKGSYRTGQREVVARLAQCEFEERYDLLERKSSIDFIDSYAAGFRIEALRSIGGFDLAFPYANNEDVDLSYRLAAVGCRLVFNRSAVVCHRHPDRWPAYLRLKVRRGYWRMMVYRLHPGKAVRDSYTPQLLKGQVFLAGAAVLCGSAALLSPSRRRQALAGTTASLGALLLSAIPFARLVARRDPALRLWAPVFVLARAAAFAAGVAGGAVSMLAFRRRRGPAIEADA